MAGRKGVKSGSILPAEWFVFGPMEMEHTVPSAKTLASVPAFMEVGGKRLASQNAVVKDGVLELAAFTENNVDEKGFPGFYQEPCKTAYAFIPFELANDEEITFGFGADWWFAAFLDGKGLVDTLGKGNGTNPPTAWDFRKTVKVAKGKHVLAVRTSSGSTGAMLCVAAWRKGEEEKPASEVKVREWVVAERDIQKGLDLYGAPRGDYAGRHVVMEADIEYGRDGNRSLKLDLLRPKDQGKKILPVVVWYHGGGWYEQGKGSGRAQVYSYFVASGDYIGISVEYRLSGEAKWPAQMHDCKASIRWIRANAKKYGMDPERIGIFGESAGGHLVGHLAVSGDVKELEGNLGNAGYSSAVTCSAPYCGVFDLEQPNMNTEQPYPICFDGIRRLLGGSIDQLRAAARQASPITYVTKDAAPMLVVAGKVDKCVPHEQSKIFAAALKKAGADVTLELVDGAGHNDLWEPNTGKKLVAFMNRHLRG